MSATEIAAAVALSSGFVAILEAIRRYLDKIRDRRSSTTTAPLRQLLLAEGVSDASVKDLLASIEDAEANDRVGALVRVSAKLEQLATSLVETQRDTVNIATKFLPISSTFDELYRRGIIDKVTVDAFRKFYQIRNKAIHGREVTPREMEDGLYLGAAALAKLLVTSSNPPGQDGNPGPTVPHQG